MPIDKEHAQYSAKIGLLILIGSMIAIAALLEIADHYTTAYINHQLDQKYAVEKW